MTVQRIEPELRIPLSRQAPCFHCGIIIDTASTGVFQRITGWTKNRASGGANQISLAERSPSWACRGCIDRLRAGVSIDQEALFE